MNRLLQSYGVAIQSGDQTMIKFASIKLNEYKEYLIREASTDVRTKDIIVQLDSELNDEFTRLQNSIEKYEKIITERSGELTSKDTDKDGISDFDESVLYNTNVNNPDSDNDGILDGVEIIGGFDPLNENQDAVITFHSPKNVSYNDSELLVIDKVSPVIETDESFGVSVQTEISGKGLPNSYVTLFVFSEPTIVTVKTSDDGSFSYTFSKELEDGEHEVYVAITDNVGAIVARSDPYRFIKTAEAFSPIDTQDAVVNTPTIENSSVVTSYNMVAAMGVVAFGLVLLMLGQALRGRSEETIEVNHAT